MQQQQQIEQMRTKNKPIKKNVLHLKYIFVASNSLTHTLAHTVSYCCLWNIFDIAAGENDSLLFGSMFE